VSARERSAVRVRRPKQHLEGQTLIAVRNVTREIGRKENAALEKVIRIIGHEINNSRGPLLGQRLHEQPGRPYQPHFRQLLTIRWSVAFSPRRP